MDRELIRYIGDVLAAPPGSLAEAAKQKRLQSIAEAKSWPVGPSQQHKATTTLYGNGCGYTVSVAKPGKEAAPGYEPLNQWDMTPLVHSEGSNLGYLPTFSNLFTAIQTLAATPSVGHQTLELLGHLFARNAYMLDHAEVSPGVWRYAPPAQVVDLMHPNVESVDGIPLDVFLQVIETIALNEDVKYTSRSGELTPAGRVNTLLTFAHLCAVFTDRAGLGDFAGGFARPPVGLSPLSQQDTRRLFPLLSPDSVRTADLPSHVGLAHQTLEAQIGYSAQQLASTLPGSPIAAGNKSRLRVIVDRVLAARLSDAELKRFRKNVVLKVIRTNDEMRPAEDVSFAPFDIDQLLVRPWAKADFRAQLTAPFLFVVFDEAPSADERLRGVFPVVLPLEDIEIDAHQTWQRTVAALRGARRDLLPKSSEGDYFVRNHAGKKSVNEAGETVTPLSFWLSRRYVQRLLLKASDTA